MKLNSALLQPGGDEGADGGSGALQACINAHGKYEPLFFVARLSRVRREAFDSIDFSKGHVDFSKLTDDQQQALSTHFHETIHWWQHVGSTFGFVYSLSLPAQSYFNIGRLQRISAHDRVFKPLKRWAQNLITEGDDSSILVNDLLDTVCCYHDLKSFRALTFDPKYVESVLADPYCVFRRL